MQKTILSHFQKKELLSTKNKLYRLLLEELFFFLVRNDHVKEDVTVRAFLPLGVGVRTKNGIISAKSSCVISGIEEVAYLCNSFTKLTPKVIVRDGVSVAPGTEVLKLSGSAKEILAYERALLNILQRMSGIATETDKYVAKVKGLKLANLPMIAATRKTPWMHLDKKAVSVGGGVTHRLDLQDGILLKDNHLELLRKEYHLKSEAEAAVYAIEHADIAGENIGIEVEMKTDDAAFAAVSSWKKRGLKNPFIILLDNYSSVRASGVIKKIKKEYQEIFFEASGGINLDNVAEFAKTGVDVISVGSLTHSPKAADLSLDIY